MEGRVLEVRIKQGSGGTVPAEALELVAGSGIVGDHHWGSTNRQVLLVDSSTLDEFGYAPGKLREQVLLDFPGLQSLAVGTVVDIADASLEITMDCAPCLHLASELGEEGEPFVRKLLGRRGMLAVVTGSGSVRAGDAVRVRSAARE